MRVVDTLLPLNNAQAVFNQDSMVKNLASAEIQTHDLLNCQCLCEPQATRGTAPGLSLLEHTVWPLLIATPLWTL